MNLRERFFKIFNFESPDRLPRWELGYWGETVKRWRREGLPENSIPQDYFENEAWYTVGGGGASQTPEVWRLRLGDKVVGKFHDFMDYRVVDYSARYEEKVFEETSEYITYRDANGMVIKTLKGTESMLQFLENPVETEADFQRYRERFDPDDESRYIENFEEAFQHYIDSNIPINLLVAGFYGQARWMFGPEKTLFNFAAEPELMADVMEFWGDFLIENSRRLLESSVPVEISLIWEDMAYKGGSLISPRHFRQFLLPQYKRVTRFFKKNGVKTIMVDTDGDVRELIPLFIEGEVDGIYPFEVAAGMDVREIREEYPELILLGGIDKRAMAQGGDVLRHELEAKIPLIKGGGYIPSCDHEVPADVSFQKYKEYLELRDKIAADVLGN